MKLIGSGSELTMSSKEIAELTGSRHDTVKISIDRLVEREVIGLPSLQKVEYINNLGL